MMITRKYAHASVIKVKPVIDVVIRCCGACGSIAGYWPRGVVCMYITASLELTIIPIQWHVV